MKDFLKTVFASALGFGITLLAGLLMLVVLITALATQDSGDGSTHVRVQPGTFLIIGNGMVINDTPEHGSLGVGSLLTGGSDVPQVDLYRALEAVDLAAKDPHIAGILIVEGLGAGLATKAELRKALEDFSQSSKKPVMAWMENPTTGEYHMMTAAKTLMLHNSGEVQLAGIASYSTYWGEGLRRLGVGVQVTKVGKYKSAVEPLIGDKMSDLARQQSQELLDDIWGRVLADVSRARSIPLNQLQKFVSSPGIFSPKRALELKLVDKIMQRDELIAEVIRAGATDDTEGSFRQVSLTRYAGKVKLPKGANRVAIVYAEGEIVDGMGTPTSTGGDRVAATLRHLRNEEEVKAVVLRVNSPGGSAFASEIIHRELNLLREKGIPLIVSMGDLAASGGYYIASPGTTVIADPMTITGSIGVFGLHFNYGELAAKLSLATDGVKTANHADLLSLHRPATAEELSIVQESVDRVYEQFLAVVGSGRKMKRDDVHEIAQGRVWSGARARKIGLVDSFGGLREAIAEACKQADLEEPGIVQFPGLHEDRRSLAEMVLSDNEDTPLFARSTKDPVMQFVRFQWQQVNAMKNLNDRRGIYLLAPIRIEER